MIKSLARWLGKPINFFISLCSLIPILLVLFFKLTSTIQLPVADVWGSALPIVIKTYDHTLQVADLFSQWFEHRLFFTKLLIVISTVFSHWNPNFETLAAFTLQILTFLMLIDIFRREQSSPVTLVLIPFSLILFSLRQRINLILGFDGVWIFVLFFTTAAFWILRCGKIGWRSLIFASLMALCSSFSVAAGLVTWFAVIIPMWMLGYRKPTYYVFWLLAAGITFFFYFHGLSRVEYLRPPLSDWPNILRYTLLMISNPMTITTQENLPVNQGLVITVVSFILFAVDAVYLWIRTRCLSNLAVWLGFALFTAFNALLTAYGRLYVNRLAGAFESRYVTLPLLYWVGLVAVGTVVIHMLPHEKPSLVHRIIAYGNMICGVAAMFLLIQCGISEATVSRVFEPQGTLKLDNSLHCIAASVLSADHSCLRDTTSLELSGDMPAEKWAFEMTNRRLGIWANYQIPLPDAYQADDRIVVLAPFAGQHVALTLPGSNQVVSSDHLLRVVRADNLQLLKSNFEQLGTVITDFEQSGREQVAAFMQGANRVWFIEASGDVAFASGFTDFFKRYFDPVNTQDNAVEFPYPVLTLYKRSGFTQHCTISQTASAVTLKDSGTYQFNNGVRVRVATGFEQHEYPELYVNLKFTGTKELPANVYSVAFHIFDAAGTKIQQVDFPVPADDETCETRLVPYTLAPGDYSVNLIIYQWETGKRVSLDSVDSSDQADPTFIRQLSQFSIKALPIKW